MALPPIPATPSPLSKFSNHSSPQQVLLKPLAVKPLKLPAAEHLLPAKNLIVELLPSEILDKCFFMARNPAVFATCKVFRAQQENFYKDCLVKFSKERLMQSSLAFSQSAMHGLKQSVTLMTSKAEDFVLLSRHSKEGLKYFANNPDFFSCNSILASFTPQEKISFVNLTRGIELFRDNAFVFPPLTSHICKRLALLVDSSIGFPLSQAQQSKIDEICKSMQSLVNEENVLPLLTYRVGMDMQAVAGQTAIFPFVKQIGLLAQEQTARVVQDWSLIIFSEAISTDFPFLDEFWNHYVSSFNTAMNQGNLVKRQNLIHTMARAIRLLLKEHAEELSTCQKLHIEGHKLVLLPSEVFAYFPSLEELALVDLGLIDLPNEIESCPALRKLKLSNNKLLRLTPAIRQLTNLEEVEVDGNMLRQFPSELSDLPALRYVDLSKNELVDLPGKLPPALQLLKLAGNKLHHIPQVLEHPSLQVLDINGNQVHDIQNWQVLKHLIGLNVSKNVITQIPVGISEFRLLEIFDASKNQIQTVPDSVRSCSALRDIRLEDNPLTSLPSHAFQSMVALETIGLSHVKKYLLDHEILAELREREVISPIIRSGSGFASLDVFRSLSPPLPPS